MVNASPHFVLVHSPLLGPSAWEWVARDLDQRGRVAIVPSLPGVDARPAPSWREICEAVAASLRHAARVVLVGHSGAGILLPAIAESCSGEVAGMAFVDAFLPPASGAARLVPAMYIDDVTALAATASCRHGRAGLAKRPCATSCPTPRGARTSSTTCHACRSPSFKRRYPYRPAGTGAPARTCCSPSRTHRAPPTRGGEAGRSAKSRAASTSIQSAGQRPSRPRCSTWNAPCWAGHSDRSHASQRPGWALAFHASGTRPSLRFCDPVEAATARGECPLCDERHGPVARGFRPSPRPRRILASCGLRWLGARPAQRPGSP
jgi:hypothetical protein